MNVDSKRYRIRSTGFGAAQITERATDRSVMVELEDVPSVTALGAMHEKEFDRTMERLMGGAA